MSAVLNAPWIARQASDLLAQRGHAWLLQGPSGLGQYELALALVSAWLCEKPTAQGACGDCPSCHAIAVHTHADLAVLMPETVMIELGWPLSEKAQDEIDKKPASPAKKFGWTRCVMRWSFLSAPMHAGAARRCWCFQPSA